MQATILEETFCRLCLNAITDSNCRVIEEVIRDVLKIVLPHVNLEENVTHFMCTTCSVKLLAAFNFKSVCMDTEDLIFPHINASKMSVIDLKKIYIKEKGNIQLIDVSEDWRICRLCFQPVTYGFVALNEVDVDIIDAYIPQIDISATRDPVICTVCFDSLRTHGSFLKNCLDAHEKYTNVDKQSYFKTEEIEIKLEDDQDSDALPETFDNEPFEKSDCKYAAEDGCKAENRAANKCDNCIYETGSALCFTAHRARHENDSEVYKCESCKYETKNKKLLQKHQLRHKNISKIRMHPYESCNYKTKCTSNLAKHQVKHKAQLYECNFCDFKSKWRTSFDRHYIKHKDKCDEHDYKTKRKALTYRATSKLMIYKCNGCNYESLDVSNFNKHQLTHKDPSQCQMYKCNECDYETKYKNEEEIYKCGYGMGFEFTQQEAQ
ncbi:zinc finger protein 700-like [Anoplophora glabripennis]|uniref:zinc finger protein 700-like n=1 Tax=Anoplophora glabripennis TaxID=217634 RepID=UPI000C787A8F|nr:zinc finger protein 700-like [Anoplophora glabripennis]